MAGMTHATDTSGSGADHPLEAFLCDYLQATGGVWDRVEPQVYDVLLPDGAEEAGSEQVVRAVFDPEALPEHAGGQFMTLGTPLMDRVLADARRRGRCARAYINGLNLHPFDLPGRLGRALETDGGRVRRVDARPARVCLAVFWFAATYRSDQEEQDLFPAAVDRYQGRQVRHLDQLLDPQRLEQLAVEQIPDAPAVPLEEAYELARERVRRTVTAAANQRRRELDRRHERQRDRMLRYYEDLLGEIEQQARRRAQREGEADRAAARRQAALQERQVRLAELARAYTLRVHVHLAHLLLIHQPKLLCEVELELAPGRTSSIPLVWDPLLEVPEAPTCPACGHPSFALRRPRPREAHPWRCELCT